MKELLLVRVSTDMRAAWGALVADGVPFAVTLERTYNGMFGWRPKISIGEHLCTATTFFRRGYATYEISQEGHERILFHKGNWPDDSDGCVLVAESFEVLNGKPGIADSKGGFDELMEWAEGAQEFKLIVKEV